jgi:hypothetical protein
MRAKVVTPSVRLLAVPLLLAGVVAGGAPIASAVARPNAAGSAAALSAHGQLHGVVATSAHNAWAVGYAGTMIHPQALIVAWNGKTWKRVPSPAPAGSVLNGVAATSARSAWAVGATGNGKTLIERWNGTAWKQVPSPTPGSSAALVGVAIVSAHDAWAVGSTFGSGGGRTLVERWNGKVWARVPSPSRGSSSNLNAVAATSAHDAWVVGSAFSSRLNASRTLAEHWNGKTWKRVTSPSPEGNGAGLSGVAAVSAHNVWAVGCSGCGIGGFAQSLIEHWNGKSWKKVHSPDPGGGGDFFGVTAVAAGNIWAVGGYYATGGESQSVRNLIARWNGKAWTRVPSPSPGAEAALDAVAAVSGHSSWAAGGYQTKAGSGDSNRTQILRGAGSAWSRSARLPAADRAAAKSVAVLSCLRHRDSKPADHVLSCSNANAWWTAAAWSHWGATSATGKGQLVRNDCAPSCAKGHFRSYPATIKLSGVRATKKYGALFSKATISYVAKGKRASHSFGLLGPVNSTPPRVKLQTPSGGEFLSPLSGMGCEIDLGQGRGKRTYCQTFTPEESVTMSPGGKLKKCSHPAAGTGCVGDPGEHTPTLHYGKATGGGTFRCLSSKTGLICTVKSGVGFVITLAHITRIRGY